jgi:type IV secretion system protein VirD4
MKTLRILAGVLLCLGVTGQWWTYRVVAQGAPLVPWRSMHVFRQTFRLYGPWQGMVWTWQTAGMGTRVVLVASIMGSLGMTGIGIRLGVKHRLAQPPALTGHGSARWARRREIRRAGLYARSGVVLGAVGRQILRFNGPENVLLVGPQRQGKGTGVIIPSLLSADTTHHEHILVVDIRGETWEHTAGYRSQFSRCLKLSLTQPHSVRFNLLDEVRRYTPHEFRDAALLAEMLVSPSGSKPDPDHWDKTSQALITCAILYEVHKQFRPTLSNVARFWSDPGHSAEATLRRVVATAPTPQVAELAQEVLNKSANEASGVLSSMMTQLFIFRDPVIAHNTNASEVRLHDFTRHDVFTSLYIVMSPGEEEHLRPFMRCFLRLALQRWLEMDGRNHQIFLILDEFTSYRRINFLAQNLAVLGGRGIRTLIAVQNIPQLRDTYGDADVITEHCKVKIYFAANGQTTGHEISRQMGTGTATTMQETRRAQGWVWAIDDSRSQQQQQHARPLLTDSESSEIPHDKAVIRVTGIPPIWAQKTPFYRYRQWRRRSVLPAPGGTHGRS